MARLIVTMLIVTPTITLGQTYQRARDVLQGSVIDEVFIYERPSMETRKVVKVPKGAPILVYGKRGAFLEIEYRNLRGWMPSQYFSMDAPTTSEVQQPAEPVRQQQIAPPPVVTRPPPQSPQTPIRVVKRPKVTQSRTVSDGSLPIRLNPYLSLAYAGKTFDKQLRVGFSGTYATSSTVSFGGVIDMVFIKGTYFDIGPIVRNQWNYNSYLLNPALNVGFLYYSFDHDGDKDSGFGFQTSIENDIMIYRDKSFQPSINLKVGMDTMFFMLERVRIPFWFAAGMTFRF